MNLWLSSDKRQFLGGQIVSMSKKTPVCHNLGAFLPQNIRLLASGVHVRNVLRK